MVIIWWPFVNFFLFNHCSWPVLKNMTGMNSYHGHFPTMMREWISDLVQAKFQPYASTVEQMYTTAILSFLYHLACTNEVNSTSISSIIPVTMDIYGCILRSRQSCGNRSTGFDERDHYVAYTRARLYQFRHSSRQSNRPNLAVVSTQWQQYEPKKHNGRHCQSVEIRD